MGYNTAGRDSFSAPNVSFWLKSADLNMRSKGPLLRRYRSSRLNLPRTTALPSTTDLSGWGLDGLLLTRSGSRGIHLSGRISLWVST